MLDTLPADDDADRTLDWGSGRGAGRHAADDRKVIVETYYRLPVVQAAATLGIPPGTVKSRTFSTR